MNFMLGVNYWDSKSGTDMWRNYDPSVIHADIKALSENGVRYLRVFPNWRDFQPVEEYLSWRGNSHGYCDYSERPLANPDGIDGDMIEHFRSFAGICDEFGIGLIVSVVTGWMSGRLFVPRVLIGKNIMTDPAALMWTNRFIHGFVSRVKDLPNIVMWDLGNECNNLGQVTDAAQAYSWTAFVRNAIAAEDPTRPISSGMHGLSSEASSWTIQTQGELTDFLTPHPYVSKTIHNDMEPMNTVRTTVYPTAQCVLYADIGGKPTVLQEQGCFSEALGNAEQNADFLRVNILSAYIHNVRGYFWWCGMNHSDLPNAPYPWSMVERELGLLNTDRTPKPVARELKKAGEILKSLPFEEMPKRKTDAVCILTAEQNHWDCAAPAFVLGKQAGIEMKFVTHEMELPKADLYLLPCISGWSVMDQQMQKALFQNVREGATAYISYNGGQFTHFEEFFGLRSHGIVTSDQNHCAEFPFGTIPYHSNQEILAEALDAEILAVNEQNNVVLSRHAYGKGTVYFLNVPMELQLSKQFRAFESHTPSDIYKLVFENYLSVRPVISENPAISVTLHEDHIVSAVNYTDRDQDCQFRIADHKKLVVLYGSTVQIPKCSASFYRLEDQ